MAIKLRKNGYFYFVHLSDLHLSAVWCRVNGWVFQWCGEPYAVKNDISTFISVIATGYRQQPALHV